MQRGSKTEYVNNFKRLRLQHGVTQKELSEALGMSIHTLRAYEKGSRGFDSTDIGTFLKTCLALECEVDDLLESEETKDTWRRYQDINMGDD